MSGFAEARADLAEAMAKLANLDRVFAMMDEYGRLLSGEGLHPELSYDPATGRVTLEVVVGRVPPRMTLAVEEAVTSPRALPTPDAGREVQPTAKARALPQGLKTGPWSDGELVTAAEMIRQGATNKEIAVRLNRSGTGIHFTLNPLRREIAEQGEAEIPSETEGATTVDMEKPVDGSRGSRQPQADADATRAGEQAPEAEEKASVAAGGSPAPSARAPGDLTLAEVRLWNHLDAVEDSDWPASRDLDMLERMMRGDGAASTAEGMGLGKPAVVARWRRLFPGEVTVERQALLVRVLQARLARGAA